MLGLLNTDDQEVIKKFKENLSYYVNNYDDLKSQHAGIFKIDEYKV
jgi:predicted oxidoreductase (fatty acid repression mutant protein)